MSQRSKKLPGEGFLGWLGRQVGYVKNAVRHPVPDAKQANATTKPAVQQTIYREQQVLEQPMPGRPEVVLRRTVIDEAVVEDSDQN